MAVRAEMGWLSLSGLQRAKPDRATVEKRAVSWPDGVDRSSQTRRGGPVRSLYGKSIQARHQIFALASRQVTEGLFDGAGKAKGSSRCAENFSRSQPGA
jgi:hypothetical protein